MVKNKYKLLILLLPFSLIGCASTMGQAKNFKELKTVEKVDVNKYMGKWYEIASIPMIFQKGCVGTTATYSLKSDGKVKVLNECRVDRLNGEYKKAEGEARVVDTNSMAKLKVSFFWPFSGDYWIIDLDKDYNYAVVGNPSREYAWILSRTPQMDETLYQRILNNLKEQDYDTNLLKRTLQEKN